MSLSTSSLTSGERLVLQRRRANTSQVQAAKKHRVSLYTYRRWEAGTLDGAPQVSLGTLKPFEQCYVKRRRKGMSMEAVAKKLGVCRFWLCEMERGRIPADDLIKFWASANGRA